MISSNQPKKNRDDEQEVSRVAAMASSVDKNIPKLCNFINFNVTKSKNVVMTLTFSDEPNSHTVIERVVVDFEHAKKIVSVLDSLIKKTEEEA